MTITVLDTYPAMRDILRAPVPERPALLRAMLEPAAGMYRYFPGEVDLVAMHGAGSGFPLDRDEARCREALDALHEADAWGRIERALGDALTVQLAATPGITVPDLTVLIVLGDPGDAHFMGPALGMTANGSVSGYLFLNFWPYPENLARLEATAVHELNHNLRYSPGGVRWDPATVTVGEQVVSEGLADAFARQLYGDELGYARIGVPHLRDDAVFAKVVSGLGVTGMENFAAWVHGDATAARYGGTPVGLPNGAGYAVGNRLVDAYLAATGRTAAQALLVSSQEVIDTALDRIR
ncbi:peptidase [Prauserella coralliicola]|nr:peptidase [Prauserella coralliicola]